MRDSDRTPGYAFRRVGVGEIREDGRESMKKLSVHEPPQHVLDRTAKPTDAKRIAETDKPSPLI